MTAVTMRRFGAFLRADYGFSVSIGEEPGDASGEAIGEASGVDSAGEAAATGDAVAVGVARVTTAGLETGDDAGTGEGMCVGSGTPVAVAVAVGTPIRGDGPELPPAMRPIAKPATRATTMTRGTTIPAVRRMTFSDHRLRPATLAERCLSDSASRGLPR